MAAEVSSTGICPYCHRRANPAVRLYTELTNEQASFTDAVFWMLIGVALCSAAWWYAR